MRTLARGAIVLASIVLSGVGLAQSARDGGKSPPKANSAKDSAAKKPKGSPEPGRPPGEPSALPDHEAPAPPEKAPTAPEK